MDWYRTNLDTGYLVKSRCAVLKLAPKRIEKALMDVLTLTILKNTTNIDLVLSLVILKQILPI